MILISAIPAINEMRVYSVKSVINSTRVMGVNGRINVVSDIGDCVMGVMTVMRAIRYDRFLRFPPIRGRVNNATGVSAPPRGKNRLPPINSS